MQQLHLRIPSLIPSFPTEAELKRKGLQRGRLVKRGEFWHVKYYYWRKDDHGNLKYTETTESTRETIKRMAQVEADKIVARANAPSSCFRGVATVRQYVEQEFVPKWVARKKNAGQIHYRTHLNNHVLPTLADMRMLDVNPRIVQMLIDAKEEAGLSPGTIRHIRNVIHKIFKLARAAGYFMGDNPTDGVILPTMVSVRDGGRAFTWEQVVTIAEQLKPIHRWLVYFLVLTGVRLGEALALRWRYINLTEQPIQCGKVVIQPHSIAVVANWGKAPHKEQETARPRLQEWDTKTGRLGLRAIPLTDDLLNIVLQIRAADSDGKDDDFIFRARTGNPIDGHNFQNRVFKPASIAAGVPWGSVHCLRHTNSTLADKAGLTVAERMKVLGHRTTEMNLHYTHAELASVRERMQNVVQMPARVEARG